MAHAPFTQLTLAFGTAAQAFPQNPQLEMFVRRLISQPLAELLSQSAYPALQAPMVQAPFTQLVEAFGTLAQATPQNPQFPGSVRRFTQLPEQFEKPVLQLPTVQTPLEHAGVPFVILAHTCPQDPQLLTSPAMYTSQPSVRVALQSA